MRDRMRCQHKTLSEYILLSQFFICRCRPLIYMINSRGPRQDPCGTPHVIDSIFESFPLTLQRCLLLVDKYVLSFVIEKHREAVFVVTRHGGHLGFFEGGPIYPNKEIWLDHALVEYIVLMEEVMRGYEMESSEDFKEIMSNKPCFKV